MLTRVLPGTSSDTEWRASHLVYCSPPKGVTCSDAVTAVTTRYIGGTNSYPTLVQHIVEAMMDSCSITQLFTLHTTSSDKTLHMKQASLHRVKTTERNHGKPVATYGAVQYQQACHVPVEIPAKCYISWLRKWLHSTTSVETFLQRKFEIIVVGHSHRREIHTHMYI
jgi:hypothetical protein